MAITDFIIGTFLPRGADSEASLRGVTGYRCMPRMHCSALTCTTLMLILTVYIIISESNIYHLFSFIRLSRHVIKCFLSRGQGRSLNQSLIVTLLRMQFLSRYMHMNDYSFCLIYVKLYSVSCTILCSLLCPYM